MKTVVIDPGHGGDDPGAVSRTGLREADLNLAFAWELVPHLHTCARVVPTRTMDSTISLETRAWFANQARADLVLSIHCNSAEDHTAEGFEIWTSRGETRADLAATRIFESVRDAFPGQRMRADYEDGDPDREAGFYVLRQTQAPAVLVELGFLSNGLEAVLLASPTWRARMAEAIAAGVRRFLEAS